MITSLKISNYSRKFRYNKAIERLNRIGIKSEEEAEYYRCLSKLSEED